jgi:hypothetical protein
MSSQPSKDAAVRLEAREYENVLATLVRTGVSTGFPDPDDDLVVDRLGEAVASMKEPIRLALIGEFGVSTGLQMVGFMLDGVLDPVAAEQVSRVLERAGLTEQAERMLALDELLVEATPSLLANPLSVDRAVSLADRTFPKLIADILRDETAEGRRVDEIAPLLADRYAGEVPIDADRALAVLSLPGETVAGMTSPWRPRMRSPRSSCRAT